MSRLAPAVGGALPASSPVLPPGVYALGFLLGAAEAGLLGVETRGRPLRDVPAPGVAVAGHRAPGVTGHPAAGG